MFQLSSSSVRLGALSFLLAVAARGVDARSYFRGSGSGFGGRFGGAFCEDHKQRAHGFLAAFLVCLALLLIAVGIIIYMCVSNNRSSKPSYNTQPMFTPAMPMVQPMASPVPSVRYM